MVRPPSKGHGLAGRFAAFTHASVGRNGVFETMLMSAVAAVVPDIVGKVGTPISQPDYSVTAHLGRFEKGIGGEPVPMPFDTRKSGSVGSGLTSVRPMLL